MSSEELLNFKIKEMIKELQEQQEQGQEQEQGQGQCAEPFLTASDVLVIMGILTGVIRVTTLLITRNQIVILILAGFLGDISALQAGQTQTAEETTMNDNQIQDLIDNNVSVKNNKLFNDVMKALVENYKK